MQAGVHGSAQMYESMLVFMSLAQGSPMQKGGMNSDLVASKAHEGPGPYE